MSSILFAPAAGPSIGGGHVIRCLTLAEALAERGARCAFAVNESGAALLHTFGQKAFAVLPTDAETALRSQIFDALVIDDYAVCAERETSLRPYIQALAVIDDLADRPHAAELLVDSGYGRLGADYDGLVSGEAVRLIGPAYALVKPAFARLRVSALDRPTAPTPGRFFMSFGLSDIDGVAGRAVAAVRRRFPEIDIDLALSVDAASSSALQGRAKADPRLHLHFNATNMAELMSTADAAIGAGGASAWERCCLGLPTLAVIVADNQRSTIEAMATDGAVLAVDLADPAFDQAFDDAITRLWARDVRAALRSKSSSLCDGLGAARVAEALLAV